MTEDRKEFSDEGVEIEITSGSEEEKEQESIPVHGEDTESCEGSSGESTDEPEGDSGCGPDGREEDLDEAGSDPAEEVTSEEAAPGTEEDTENGREEAGGQEDAADPDNGKKPGKKPSFFGKKKKENDKFQQQIEDLTDRLKRSLAEFDNYRKRTEKEKSSMYIIGARDIVEKILPVVDNFERGLAQAPEGDPFADGMKLVYKQLMTALEDMGVKPIEAVGKEFNPDFHNAVMHVEDEEAGENIVVEEFQKGYTYKDFVVRHSMVKVAN